MVNQESYRRAFMNMGDRPEITLETLNKRKKEISRRRARNSTIAAMAVVLMFVGSNAVSYAKSGEFWVTSVLKFTTGNGITVEVEDGNYSENESVSKVSITSEDVSDYYKVENDRLFFQFKGTKEDITDKCSDSDYYKHEYTDEDSLRHVVVVGGTVQNPGWAEYVFDKDNNLVFNMAYNDGETEGQYNMQIEEKETGDENTSEFICRYDDDDVDEAVLNTNKPDWMKNAEKDLGIE